MTIIQKIFPKKYSYEDWIVDFSDVVIKFTKLDKTINQNYINFFGQPATDIKEIHDIQTKFNLFSPKVIDLNFDPFNKFCSKVHEDIKNHLVYNDYITIQPNVWTLTERGFLLKELGGHKKFIKHRHRELSVLRNQFWINVGLIIVGFASVFMPLIVEWTKPNKPTEIFFNKKVDSIILRQTIIFDSIKTDIHKISDSLQYITSNQHN
jgi:hypothetical protein